MREELIARVSIDIDASRDDVWDALVKPEAIKQYMFGAEVESNWREGDSITWKGEWEGRRFEDKGVILKVEPGRMLRYSHFSPLSGLPDEQANYHTVTIDLSGDGSQTHVSLTQDNNPTEREREHSERNWNMMLGALKKHVES
jgi:uncharacterized protein YndB with AHSA1/START domain